jgi:hypothetical protein
VGNVLRIANEDVRPLHRGELRVLIAAARPAGLGQVRAYLSADLLRRYAERSGLAPSVIDFSPAGPDILRGVCDALNIHPPRHTLTSPFTPEQLDGLFPGGLREPVFDVGVRLAGETAGGTLAARWIDVPPEPRQAGLGEEPLSVRMNLMGFEGDAAETLRRWRKRVATWAESPSGAMSRAHADAIAAAFDDGLDTAAALRALAELDADESVADGVKFETFAAADRLFGLDLARDIGK